jgi:hypothetical protein
MSRCRLLSRHSVRSANRVGSTNPERVAQSRYRPDDPSRGDSRQSGLRHNVHQPEGSFLPSEIGQTPPARISERSLKLDLLVCCRNAVVAGRVGPPCRCYRSCKKWLMFGGSWPRGPTERTNSGANLLQHGLRDLLRGETKLAPFAAGRPSFVGSRRSVPSPRIPARSADTFLTFPYGERPHTRA